MVSANIQMAASLSTVKSVAGVSGASKGSNVLGKYCWLQPPVLVGTCLIPLLFQYWKTPARPDFQEALWVCITDDVTCFSPLLSLEYLVSSASPA